MEHALRTSALGTLTLEALDEQQIAALSTRPSPPGSLLHIESDAGGFAIKVHSCKKLPDEDPRFRISGRPVNLSRRVREHLESCLRDEEPT